MKLLNLITVLYEEDPNQYKLDIETNKNPTEEKDSSNDKLDRGEELIKALQVEQETSNTIDIEDYVKKGKILTCDQTCTEEKILYYCRIPKLNLDLTNILQTIKDKIVEVEGNLIDLGVSYSYMNLTTIGGHAIFTELTNAKGLKALNFIVKDANFRRLPNADGLDVLNYIGKHANFRILKNSKGLKSLSIIGGSAAFYELPFSEGLESLGFIRKHAHFNELTNGGGLRSLSHIGNERFFAKLTYEEKQKIPVLRI